MTIIPVYAFPLVFIIIVGLGIYLNIKILTAKSSKERAPKDISSRSAV